MQKKDSPGQFGLLPGFDQPPAPSTLSQDEEYDRYLRSPQWRQIRHQALEAAGHKCQRCGVSKWSATLEVHHLTYDRFQREQPNDLIVLCEKCHKEADEERRRKVERDNAAALDNARFTGWARKVYGEEWQDAIDPEEARDHYMGWREQRG